MSIALLGIDPVLVERLDRSGPRYTSYPTALEFHPGVDEAAYGEHLMRANEGEPGAPLSLYIHIPFCEKLCTFCACHFIPTPHHEVTRPYLTHLAREAELLAERLPARRELAQVQWGGGTPTYLAPAELEELFGAVARHFPLAPSAEVAIEVDPRFTTRAHLETLARLGFNRLSLGVQDFTPAVQQAIGRGQTFEETRALVDAAREIGFSGGVNFDLIYGLPLQDEKSFQINLDRLLELAPERVAMYSFAYVPWARPHQKQLDASVLPAREVKLELYLAALGRLLGAGYQSIGMDHFARPGDELARAAREGRLERNFMGYTVRPASAQVALGLSGITEVEGAYFQNQRKLPAYYRAIDAGQPPIERGYVLNNDDRLRQHIIRRLLCRFELDPTEIETHFGITFEAAFPRELAALDEAREQGLIERHGRRFRVTDLGRLFVRNLAMIFDRYLETHRERPAYSRTV